MTHKYKYRLDGLEPDNLLAFLSMIGLLRALEASHSDWRPRLGWDLDRAPLRPVLQLAEDVDNEAISAAAVEGLEILAPAQDFNGRKSIDFAVQEARTCLQGEDEARRRVLECLLSDAAYKDDGKPFPPPLCMLFGQGHQHFLDRFSQVPVQSLEHGRQGVLPASDVISAALFRPWERRDAANSFRWDPQEANRYALRAKDPSSDNTAKTTQHGANQLASIALPALPAVPVCRRGEPRILSIGAAYDQQGMIMFRWPIWRGFATLSAVRAMLSHPGIHDGNLRSGLRYLGFERIMEARRISVGKFMNVEPARPVALE